MAIVDYESLKAAFATMSKRGDTANYVDVLQGLAEKRIKNDLRVAEMEVNYELICDEEYEALPADFLEPTKINDEDPDLNGNFDSFEIVGKTLKVTPVASASNVINVDINYYAEQSALVNDSDTHTTLVAHSNVYLSALMLELAVYKESQKLQDTWLTYYTDAINQANALAELIKYPSGSLQVRNV